MGVAGKPHDVQERFRALGDLEDEVRSAGQGCERALVAEGEGFVGLPGATGSVEGPCDVLLGESAWEGLRLSWSGQR